LKCGRAVTLNDYTIERADVELVLADEEIFDTDDPVDMAFAVLKTLGFKVET